MAAWDSFSVVPANASHHALAHLEGSGHVKLVITQNVDVLHQKAGSHNVIELHGNQHVIKCQQCAFELSRAVMQSLLINSNPEFWCDIVIVY